MVNFCVERCLSNICGKCVQCQHCLMCKKFTATSFYFLLTSNERGKKEVGEVMTFYSCYNVSNNRNEHVSQMFRIIKCKRIKIMMHQYKYYQTAVVVE